MAMLQALRLGAHTCVKSGSRDLATLSASHSASVASRSHKVAIVGGGSAGLTIGHQLLRTGAFRAQDIAIVDPNEWHHYQPGWTLVGGGLKDKRQLRARLSSLVDPKISLYAQGVSNFTPEQNTIDLINGHRITYDQLVVCPGIKVDFKSIKGLDEAVHDPHSPVSSIYSYDTCDKTARNIASFKKGKAIFTHPAGVVKCAGAPQKIMWLALDGWRRAGLYNPGDPSKSDTQITFATAMPVMFGVPKYSQRLNELREQRAVDGLFEHDLVGINGNTATLAKPDGSLVEKHFDLLHAVPKMKPYDFVKASSLANESGFVDIDQATLQHNTYGNVWSAGDASGLPTSKTAAAITAQAPVLVSNLLSSLDKRPLQAVYNGYTSCPLLTEYGKVMLAEFKYGGTPHETFGTFVDQGTPRRAFYHLKKDFFPWVYYKFMVEGTWAGPKGWKR
ncbi:uncharacterized protein F5Z01DRAFT_273066 [Emericellopsis atlantica]|uniref:FAD/NAD(P)-binding domain-containing protein n=1 Tax=Emericellopsis atlantica TaxID=2614577 RepID=A0A9P7ZGE8_9HYPO|nr:uncharacterized protein F5Z01DRAFT_273066 [Emericellopsis atlantica]KAG9251619.1 hypothetical protein F5Z01DRAFT_273066 [Emericellopsis atlantica]